jgi:hypothetical protein
MKITKALLLSAALIAAACNDDDDKSSLETAKLSLSTNTTVIEAPAAMQSSENSYAQMANSWVQVANGMTQYLSYLELPEGAAKSTNRITASNARVKETGDVLVYTWTDEQSGYSVAYQVSEESDRFVWEIFLKESGSDWIKFFHAEEKKDRSEGFMKIYDAYGDDPSVVIVMYEWSRSGDLLTLTLSTDTDKIIITVNEKTGAGSVVSIENGVKTYEMTWDAQGNGSWTYYEGGQVSDSGTWEA